MNDLLGLIRRSKTAKSGVVTILLGVLLLFGVTGGSAPESIDQMETEAPVSTELIVGIVTLLAGGMTLKGRSDAEKRIKKSEGGEHNES